MVRVGGTMFKDGVLVDLHIGFWRAHKSLDPIDLKMRREDIPDIFKLGTKLLMPQEELKKFNNLEHKARKRLEALSFPFFVGTTCRFVPLKSLQQVVEDLKKAKVEFEYLVSHMIDNYRDNREKMLIQYHDIRESLEPFYPTITALYNKYYFKWNVFEIGEITEACASELKEEYDNFKRKLSEEFNIFLESSVKELRSEVSSTCVKLLKRIENGEIIKDQTINSVRNVIDRFEKLNFVGDLKVSQSLEMLKGMIATGSGKDFSESVEMKQRLGNLAKEVSVAANDLSDIDTITGEYLRKIRVRS